MTLYNYIGIYLAIGTVIMLILDITFSKVKDMIPEEFQVGYTNPERVYIIFVWPIFSYNLIKSVIKGNK